MTVDILDADNFEGPEFLNEWAPDPHYAELYESLTVSERTRTLQFIMTFEDRPQALAAAVAAISRAQRLAEGRAE